MSRWTVLAATPLLLIPLAFAGVSVAYDIEHRESRATVVLPSLVQGPQVTMRPTAPGQADPDKRDPAPPQGPELHCTQDDDDDDRDDEVEVVQPCPAAVGDDDDDDDEDDDGDD